MTLIPPADIKLDELDRCVPKSGQFYKLGEELEQFLRHTITAWKSTGLVKQDHSFGLVVAGPGRGGKYHDVWDQPQLLIAGGLVIGWGTGKRRHGANALCMMRIAAREGIDTLEIADNTPEKFRLNRYKTGNTPFIWGDFPHGGAVLVGNGVCQLLVGVCGLTPPVDDMVAKLAANFLNMRLSDKVFG